LARYAVRDLFGHFVSPPSQRGRTCKHACCRGRRPHPENYPVILPAPYLRAASDQDLAMHFTRHADNERVTAQVLHEMQRRDDLAAHRNTVAKRRKERAFDRRMAHAEVIEWSWTEAEAATNGNMVNRKGLARGVDDRTLFTSDEAYARRYASEELLAWWQDHPRPTAGMMRGEDTRLGARYTAPRRRRTGVTEARIVGTRRL
jgi:hypothetical protein